MGFEAGAQYQTDPGSYRANEINRASAKNPAIINIQNVHKTVDTMLAALRLSLFRTQAAERIRPSRAKTILTPAQTVRIPSGSERCSSDGIRAASGRTLKTSAATLIE